MKYFFTLPFFLLIVGILHGQSVPPCDLTYGSATDEQGIIQAMRYSSVAEAIASINLAKESRGPMLGCAEVAIPRQPADTSPPTLANVAQVWTSVHQPEITGFSVSCPRIGRYENNSALGAYYAAQAGYFQDVTSLSAIAQMMLDQQYKFPNVDLVNPRHKGVFGYVFVPETDPCYTSGVVGTSVAAACDSLPQFCTFYRNGQFEGERFLIAAQDDASGWFDGGLAFDHGWVAAQLLEASFQQPDEAFRQRCRRAFLDAADYAITEHAVKNHNYTAKLIWVLAKAYALTEDQRYEQALYEKLQKNLIPGILWDEDQDGLVDGITSDIAFSTLAKAANTPGRMWDGHNSVPWYQAMNAWAMLEAYVAYRDVGNTVKASALKPYAVAMLDNLAKEILEQGIFDRDLLGVRDVSYALLLGIWELAQFESEAHPTWRQAAWAMWNAGYFNRYTTSSVCVGLYLTVINESPFIPLPQREEVSNLVNEAAEIQFLLSPNPTRDGMVTIQLPSDPISPIPYEIKSALGQTISNGIITTKNHQIDLTKSTNQNSFLYIVLDHSKANKIIIQRN